MIFVSAFKVMQEKTNRLKDQKVTENFSIKKDMGNLARGGFSFDLSKEYLNLR